MNSGSLAEALPVIHRELRPPLLDARGGRRLLEVARTLPPALARRPVGLELRLAGRAAADLVVCARPSDPDGRAVLDWARSTGQTQLVRALEAWCSGFGWLAWSADQLLLEFDASVDVRALPAVYLAPKRASNGGPVEVPDNAFHADPDGLVGALAALAGAPPDPSAVAELRRVLSVLPPFAEIFVAGAMLSRTSARSPRIVVRRFRPGGIETLLTALDRRGAAGLGSLATELGPLGARFALVLDLGDSAPGAAGLEIYAGRYWSDGSPDGWAPVLETLVANGLAERGHAEAALSLPRSRREGRAAFGISHVKVSADAAGLHRAKLYLGVDGLSDEIAASDGVRRAARPRLAQVGGVG